MVSAENATDATSRRVRLSRRGVRSENHQPDRPRNRPEWRHWRRSWSSFDKRRRSPKSHHSKKQVRRRRRHTKWRSRRLDNCNDCSATVTRRSERLKQSLTKRRRPVTNPCPSARGFEQARTRSLCTERETSRRPKSTWKRRSEAPWLPRRVWSSTDQSGKRRNGAARAAEKAEALAQTSSRSVPRSRGHADGSHVPRRYHQAHAPGGKGQP